MFYEDISYDDLDVDVTEMTQENTDPTNKVTKINTDKMLIELDKRSNIIFGENNSAEYTAEALGDPRLALFFKLVHSLPEDEIRTHIDQIYSAIKKTKNPQMLIDLFVILFQTRDPRGGKGRRELFYNMVLIIYEYFPTIVLNLLCFVPGYGYFKDYFNLLEMINNSANPKQYAHLVKKIYLIVANQIKLDVGEYENAAKESRKPIISLLAKYIPKEGKHFDKQYNFVEILSNIMYPGISDVADRKKAYRIQVAILNKLLDVTEIKMSANKFSEIVFSKITSKNALKYRKAFLNLNINKSTQRSMEKDRIDARTHFIQSIRDKKIKGGTLEVYDIVKSIIDYIQAKTYSEFKHDPETQMLTSDADWEEELLKTQWEDMRVTLVNKIDKSVNHETNRSFSIDNMIPIVDVSGSMSGMPMYVAIGLGILVSEMNQTINSRILTFSESPEWVDLQGLDIIEKIDKVMKSKWGMNTNFEKVYGLLIDVVKTKKLKQSEIPNLIVFSDMQFDAASTSGINDTWETHYAKIFREFHDLGIEISGKPYDPPMIVFWNLRGDTRGFPVMKDTQNVKMLSGFSPNLLQYVMNGEVESQMAENNSVHTSVTPYKTMRSVLDDARYEPIREVVGAMLRAA